MTRWILRIACWELRLHKFFRGDDDRAPHDHPFDFWTFPLTTYSEEVFPLPEYDPLDGEVWAAEPFMRHVRRFRAHHRPAYFRHIVHGRVDRKNKPFYTIVLARRRRERKWGFWPTPTTFVYWKLWI